MKKYFFLSLIMLSFCAAEAQDTVIPWHYSRYHMTHRPPDSAINRNIEPVPTMDGCCLDQKMYKGQSFYAPETSIYGVAASIGWTVFPDLDGHRIAIDPAFGSTQILRNGNYPIWALIAAKDGPILQRIDSVPWHYRSKPDRVWRGIDGMPNRFPRATEFYFDHPIKIPDTFFVCIGIGRDSIVSMVDTNYNITLNLYSYLHVCPGHNQLDCISLTPMRGGLSSCLHDNYNNPQNRVDTFFVRNYNHVFLQVYPIIAPPDTDAVGCPAPGLRFYKSLSGFPWFKYTLTTDEEALEYEVKYALSESNDWDTIRPTSNPFKISGGFDSTRYYKALFRSKHRHGCPIHDTVYWSPWSDTVLFYSGTTAPDTTNSIIPVVAETHAPFFTLTPNPTDGKVIVEVKSDKSGEATITVCNATGREILKQKASTLNSQLSTLNLEGFPAGTYFVTVTIGGQSGTRKLVVK